MWRKATLVLVILNPLKYLLLTRPSCVHDNQLIYVVILQSNGYVQELMPHLHKMALNLCGWQQYMLVTMLRYVSVNLEYVQIFQCWPVMIPP